MHDPKKWPPVLGQDHASKKLRVVVTRPLPDGERTAAALRAQGHDVLLTPLMQVQPVLADTTGHWSGVIITSANAVRVLSGGQLAPLLTLPLYAVGERSADAARDAGFRNVHSAQGDADALVRLVVGARGNETAPYLYLAGENRAADIETTLARENIKLTTVIVYRNVTSDFPPELINAIAPGAIDAVLHFSRRSAENYLASAKVAGLASQALRPRQLCLSPQVAEPFAGAASTEIASKPNEAALLALLARS